MTPLDLQCFFKIVLRCTAILIVLPVFFIVLLVLVS